MKKIFVSLFILIITTACNAPQTTPEVVSVPTSASQPTASTTANETTLYISATMHIESKFDSWPQDTQAFLNFLQQTINAGIRWSIGGDIGWLESAENAQEIVTRSATMGVQWDVHAHKVEDYAKIAYILYSWGVTPTGVSSGFLIEDFDRLQQTYTYNGNSWSPTIIWGGVVCPGHRDGCDDHSISLYRPTSTAEFYTHNPNGNLIKLGGGSHQLADVELLASQIAQGQYPYPVIGFTIMVEPETLRIATSDTDDINVILAFVESMNKYSFVKWATIEETATHWEQAGSVAFQIE
jgi:hypothetical protein